MSLRKFIRTILKEQEEKVSFSTKEDEDRIEMTLKKGEEKMGKIGMEILFEPYQYEFSDVFTEEQFEKIFPEPNIVKIEYLEVKDAYKGMGYGKLLMKKGLAKMKVKGYKQFYLNASPMGFSGLQLNDLVDFYESFGFRGIKYQGGNVLMALTL